MSLSPSYDEESQRESSSLDDNRSVVRLPTIEWKLTPLEQQRIDTHVSQHRASVGSKTGEPHPVHTWLAMGAGKDVPAKPTDPDAYLVEFDSADDPLHPFNWTRQRKLTICGILCFATFCTTLTSGMFGPAIPYAREGTHLSAEVGRLGTALFVAGFAFGPIIWAPISELVGRQWPLTMGIFGVSIFTISAAVAKDTQTLMITRFFGGVFGACLISVVPAVITDMYDHTRDIALQIYCVTVFAGPFCAPFIGGFIVDSLYWRWTLYISSFACFLSTVLNVCFLEETYPPIILSRKAATLRRQTLNWGIHAKQEEVEVTFSQIIQTNFTRPIVMLFTEPIILAVTVYMSFIYGITYALLIAYPGVFQEVYGMNTGQSGLTFIGLIIGLLLGAVFLISLHPWYMKRLAANDYKHIPEWRLPPTVVGAPVFTAGLFWFGWTGYTSSIHWLAPTAAGVLIGFGLLCIFQPCFNYLIDSYLTQVASTIAANMMLRSAVAAGFPLFSWQMFANLGIQWAGTLLGCLAALMIPIPVVFIVYGPWIRSKSRLTP